ncbi:MAG: MFS transporter [Actinomycetota bacterium]|nr:MFS transporter [Actinomycetota bacterium]
MADANGATDESTSNGTPPGAAASGDGPLPGVREEHRSLRAGLAAGGARTFWVLLLLSSLDELEAAGLSVLAPDIRDTFGLSDGTIVVLSAAAGAVIVLGVIPMGWLADRFRRPPIVGAASLALGAMVFASGLAANAFLFFLARVGAGLAKSNTLPVHGSLLADTYPIGVRGRLSAATGVAGRVLGVAAPVLVGAVAALAGGDEGWRWAYLLFGLPLSVVGLLAFTLKEPTRGRWEKQDVLGHVFADDDPLPISTEAAFARLRAIRTLRTVMLAFASLGFFIFTVPVLTNLFLEDTYGLGTVGRGVVTSVTGAAGLVALPFIGRFYDQRYQRDPASSLRLIGMLILPAAVLVPIQYLMPNAVLFAIAGIPGALVLSAAFVMIAPLLQTITPYRLRGLGLALGSIYVFFVGATGGAIVAAPITNHFGTRAAIIAVLVPATLVGGGLIIRSARFIRGDLAMIAAELTEEEAERDRQRSGDALPVVQVGDVDFSYGPVQVLFGVSFEVREGEVLALLGTNGAGKSTILDLISGLQTAERGVIRLRGRTVTFTSPEQRGALGVRSLAGGKGVYPSLTVADNLAVATLPYRRDPDDVRRRTRRVLDLFPTLSDLLDRRAGSLSGGQQQTLAMALTLVHDADVLLIDELSLGLSPKVVEELLGVVERLRAEGQTMIVVEQSLNVALAISDRAVFLEKGHVRFEGPSAELAERDDLARAVFLGAEGG